MTKQIALSLNGKKNKGQYFAIVDDEDFERVNQYRWCVSFNGARGKYYAIRTIRINGKRKTVFMHRFIMSAPDNMEVDHRDSNGLLNTRDNLRICTPHQNQGNSKLNKTNKSGYKGVSWDARNRKWQASIKRDGKARNLGSFSDPISAAHAYDSAALKYFGEFAFTNFPKEAL